MVWLCVEERVVFRLNDTRRVSGDAFVPSTSMSTVLLGAAVSGCLSTVELWMFNTKLCRVRLLHHSRWNILHSWSVRCLLIWHGSSNTGSSVARKLHDCRDRVSPVHVVGWMLMRDSQCRCHTGSQPETSHVLMLATHGPTIVASVSQS